MYFHTYIFIFLYIHIHVFLNIHKYIYNIAYVYIYNIAYAYICIFIAAYIFMYICIELPNDTLTSMIVGLCYVLRVDSIIGAGAFHGAGHISHRLC